MLSATLTLAALTLLLALDDTTPADSRQTVPVETDDRDTPVR